MAFNVEKIPLYKKIISFFHPVWLSHHQSEINPYLELLLYRGRVQLATTEALYSDGDKYTPALGVLNDLKRYMPQVKSVLILGVGLGSTVSIIRKRGYNPRFTLVEIDEVVLQLALENLAADKDAQIEAICADAQVFVANNKQQYDLVFIDIFNSRTVPDFVSSLSFLSNCHKGIASDGRIAFNYIINNDEDWIRTQQSFTSVFPKHHVISSDINRLFVGEV